MEFIKYIVVLIKIETKIEYNKIRSTTNYFELYLTVQTKEQKLGKKLAIFWDGASYHNSQEFRELLKLINQEKAEEKWWINCLKFAPNAP